MIGKSVPRVDAYDKVTGRAKFTDDLVPANCLVAKIYHAKIGNGIVKSIDTSKAEALDGVVKWLLLKTYRIIVILRRDIPGLWSWLIRMLQTAISLPEESVITEMILLL